MRARSIALAVVLSAPVTELAGQRRDTTPTELWLALSRFHRTAPKARVLDR